MKMKAFSFYQGNESEGIIVCSNFYCLWGLRSGVSVEVSNNALVAQITEKSLRYQVEN